MKKYLCSLLFFFLSKFLYAQSSSWVSVSDFTTNYVIGSRPLEEVLYRLHRNLKGEIVQYYLFEDANNSRVLLTPNRFLIIKTETDDLIKCHIVKVLDRQWEGLFPEYKSSSTPILYSNPNARLEPSAEDCLNKILIIFNNIPKCKREVSAYEREESRRDSIYKILEDINEWTSNNGEFYSSKLEWDLHTVYDYENYRIVFVFGNRVIYEVEISSDLAKDWLRGHFKNKRNDGSFEHVPASVQQIIPFNYTEKSFQAYDLWGCGDIGSAEKKYGKENFLVKLIKPTKSTELSQSVTDYYGLNYVNEEVFQNRQFLKSDIDTSDVNSIVFCPPQILNSNYDNLEKICNSYLIEGGQESDWLLITDDFNCSGCTEKANNMWKYTIFNSQNNIVRIKDGANLDLLLSNENFEREKVIYWLNEAFSLSSQGRLNKNEIEFLGKDGIVFKGINSNIVFRDSKKEIVYTGETLNKKDLQSWLNLFSRNLSNSSSVLKKSDRNIVLDFFINISKGKNDWITSYRQNPLAYLSKYSTVKTF